MLSKLEAETRPFKLFSAINKVGVLRKGLKANAKKGRYVGKHVLMKINDWASENDLNYWIIGGNGNPNEQNAKSGY